MSKFTKESITPDIYSWLSNGLKDYFKVIKNEYFLSLFDALTEYTAFHVNFCAFFPQEDQSIEIYPEVRYDLEENIAILERVFFVSEKAYKILNYDALKVEEAPVQKKPIKTPFNIIPLKSYMKETKKEYDEVNHMVLKNNMEPSQVRELSLKKSFERNELKKRLIIKNEEKNINYENINKFIVLYDLSFLEKSGFLNVKRYSSFRNILPDDFKVEVVVDLDFKIPEIPAELKREQLIDFYKLKE